MVLDRLAWSYLTVEPVHVFLKQHLVEVAGACGAGHRGLAVRLFWRTDADVAGVDAQTDTEVGRRVLHHQLHRYGEVLDELFGFVYHDRWLEINVVI